MVVNVTPFKGDQDLYFWNVYKISKTLIKGVKRYTQLKFKI